MRTWSFPVQAINVKNVFNVFNVASVRTHFYVKKLFWTKNLQTDTNQSTLKFVSAIF